MFGLDECTCSREGAPPGFGSDRHDSCLRKLVGSYRAYCISGSGRLVMKNPNRRSAFPMCHCAIHGARVAPRGLQRGRGHRRRGGIEFRQRTHEERTQLSPELSPEVGSCRANFAEPRLRTGVRGGLSTCCQCHSDSPRPTAPPLWCCLQAIHDDGGRPPAPTGLHINREPNEQLAAVAPLRLGWSLPPEFRGVQRSFWVRCTSVHDTTGGSGPAHEHECTPRKSSLAAAGPMAFRWRR